MGFGGRFSWPSSSGEYPKKTSKLEITTIAEKALIKLSSNKDFLIRLKRYVIDYFVDKIKDNEDAKEFRPEGKFFTTLKESMN